MFANPQALMKIKLASWNVNGLRAVMKKDALQPFLTKYKPDILGLQEIKIDADMLEKEKLIFPGYTAYYNSAKRPGYSGTAVLVKDVKLTPRGDLGVRIVRYFDGLHVKGSEEFDNEGRVQTLEFSKFYFVNVYFPNSREDLSRIDFKSDFNKLVLKHIQKLEQGSAKQAGKPVILTGDYNVAHNEIDLARPKENEGKHGYHPSERQWMTRLLEAGYIDTFRILHPNLIKYSWWSTRFGQKARTNNVGWRIDYFCVSKNLFSKVTKADILDKTVGSDHAPVTLELEVVT